jgi:hypothetical protein
MGIKKEEIVKALKELEDVLTPEQAADVDKSSQSEPFLDNAEGDDLDGGHMSNKMSDSAKEGSGKEGQKKMKKDGKKSFRDDLSEEVETKVEVSDFLKSLVNTTGDAIDNLRESLTKSQGANDGRFSELAEAVEDIQKSQAKLGVVLKAICEQIGVIGNEPASKPKAEQTVAKSGVAERKFENPTEDGEQSGKMFKSLSDNPLIAKSQISEALCELVRKGEAADTDVIGFESGGYINPTLVSKLKEKLN